MQSPTKDMKLPDNTQANATTLAKKSTTLPQLACLIKCDEALSTSDGHQIDIWELSAQLTEGCLSEWASNFRQNYCSDSEIDELRNGTGLSRAEYLTQLVFPDESIAPGPAIRSGDFAELLVSDYVEYILGYWVPRGKYAEKMSRDESVKGVDILGVHLASPTESSPADTLLAFEVKAQLTGNKYMDRLQTAVNDSSKDYLRRATTLNATKRRLLRAGRKDRALHIQRFQNLSDHPYVYRSGAAAVLSDASYDESLLQSSTKVEEHQNASNLELIVIRGKELMALVHSLYKRATDEA